VWSGCCLNIRSTGTVRLFGRELLLNCGGCHHKKRCQYDCMSVYPPPSAKQHCGETSAHFISTCLLPCLCWQGWMSVLWVRGKLVCRAQLQDQKLGKEGRAWGLGLDAWHHVPIGPHSVHTDLSPHVGSSIQQPSGPGGPQKADSSW
jgi:hypothetical protein